MYTIKHNATENKISTIVLAKVQNDLQEEDNISYKKKKEKLGVEKLEQHQNMQNDYSTFSYTDHDVNSNYGLSTDSCASGYKSNGIVLYKW